MTYKCDNCGATFDEPLINRWKENQGECFGFPAIEEWETHTCPDCGSGNIWKNMEE